MAQLTDKIIGWSAARRYSDRFGYRLTREFAIYFATSNWEKYRTVRDHLESKWHIELRFEPRVALPEEPSDALGVLSEWGIDVLPLMKCIADPGIAHSIRSKALVILAPNLFIFKCVGVP